MNIWSYFLSFPSFVRGNGESEFGVKHCVSFKKKITLLTSKIVIFSTGVGLGC